MYILGILSWVSKFCCVSSSPEDSQRQKQRFHLNLGSRSPLLTFARLLVNQRKGMVKLIFPSCSVSVWTILQSLLCLSETGQRLELQAFGGSKRTSIWDWGHQTKFKSLVGDCVGSLADGSLNDHALIF